MAMIEIAAKSILITRRCVDSWFVSGYGMNLYRGCSHDCAYCDGRAETYRVEGEFGTTVGCKPNAPDVLRRELDPGRRRSPWKRSFIMLGGGVGDSYQPAEAQLQLTRRALELLAGYHHPVHILTKSCLVERDLDLLTAIHRTARALICMSLSTADDDLAAIMEPGCPLPSQRLAALRRIKEAGLPTGLFLMPLLPGLTDTEPALRALLEAGRRAGVDFVLCAGMTLKAGRQKAHYVRILRKHFPGLAEKIEPWYPAHPFGAPSPAYHNRVLRLFGRLAKTAGLPRRMPPRLYADLLSDHDRLGVMLEHLDDLSWLEGKPSGFRKAARLLRAFPGPLADRLEQAASQLSPGILQAIQEILATGCSQKLVDIL